MGFTDLDWTPNLRSIIHNAQMGSFAEESFPDADDIDVPENLQRPFRLSFEKVKEAPGKRPIESAFEADSVARPHRFIQEWLGGRNQQLSTTINNYQQLSTIIKLSTIVC